MSLALTRTETAYRVEPTRPRSVPRRRDYAELLSKAVILTLFSVMAAAIGQHVVQTGRLTSLLLLVSEGLVVALTLVRRTASVVDRSWKARTLTIIATFGPTLVRPAGVALAAEVITVTISAIGLLIVVFGKLSLGRSFGLTPANRGVVSSGLYRMVRHPIYLGYLITHVGFLMANPANLNPAILFATDIALMLRAICEEKTLALDAQYRAYMTRVRWRIIPGVF